MPDAKQTHAFDQMFAAVASLGALTARFYASLIAEGVPEAAATILTSEFQRALVANAMGRSADEVL